MLIVFLMLCTSSSIRSTVLECSPLPGPNLSDDVSRYILYGTVFEKVLYLEISLKQNHVIIGSLAREVGVD